jgi:hypothetical protein
MVLGENSVLLVTHGVLPGVYGSAADRHLSTLTPQGYWMGSSDVLQGDREVSSATAAKSGGFMISYSDGEFTAPGLGGVSLLDVSPAGPRGWIGASPFPASGVRAVVGDAVSIVADTAWPQTGGGSAAGKNQATPRYYVESSTTNARQRAIDQAIVTDHFKMLSFELAIYEGVAEDEQWWSPAFCSTWLTKPMASPAAGSVMIDQLLQQNWISHGNLRIVRNPTHTAADDKRKQRTPETSAIVTGAISADVPFIVTANDEGPYYQVVQGLPDGRPRLQRLLTSLHEFGHYRRDLLIPDAGDSAKSAANDREVIFRCGALMLRIDGTYPLVTDMSPRSGASAGGNEVTIEGKNFMPTAIVSFGNNTAASMTFVSSTRLKAIVPAGVAQSWVEVKVTTPTGEWGRYYNGYEYNP